MALFEIDNGRLVPAQFGRQVPGAFTERVLTAIKAQVLEVVSRPLFPITWRDISGTSPEDGPRLTALDATGQVVAVEVLRRLDADILIESLSRLADTATMSWSDLAREYPLGPKGFRDEWVMFREAMPTAPPNGPRLILVASEISEEVRPALDVLSSSGIEVHQMTMRQMTDGRTFLDVETVGPRLYGHRVSNLLEASAVIPVLRGGDENADDAQTDESHRLTGGEDHEAPSAPVSSVAASSVPASRRAPAPVVSSEPVAKGPDPVSKSPSVWAPLKTSPAPPESSVPRDPEKKLPGVVASNFESPVAHEQGHAATAAPSDRAFPPRRAPRRTGTHASSAQAETRASSFPPAPPVPLRRRRETLMPPGSRLSSRSPGIPQMRRSQRHQQAGNTKTVLSEDSQGLAALAEAAGQPVALSLRPSGLTPRDAALLPGGKIAVPAGEFSDPTMALEAEGIRGQDGWRLWRIGRENGPTLSEALEELNAALARS